MNWVLTNVPGVCSPDQPNHFTCPGATVFFNASVIWGVRTRFENTDGKGYWSTTDICSGNDLFGYVVVLFVGRNPACSHISLGQKASKTLDPVYSYSNYYGRLT